MNLAGKVCMVTGASGGIGAASALTLAAKGAHIAAFGRRSDDQIAALRDQVQSLGVRFCYGTGNVEQVGVCEALVRETVAEFGKLDVLVHLAGDAVPGSLLSLDVADWHRAFDVHIHSAFYLCRAAVPYMKAAGEGSIILISSAAGLRGINGAIAYSVVKGAIPQFVRSLARELADDRIRVNAVAPGVIRTPFQDYLSLEQVKNNIENRIPLHREGTPVDVAEAITTLVTNEFITGETLTIDGGMTMRIV